MNKHIMLVSRVWRDKQSIHRKCLYRAMRSHSHTPQVEHINPVHIPLRLCTEYIWVITMGKTWRDKQSIRRKCLYRVMRSHTQAPQEEHINPVYIPQRLCTQYICIITIGSAWRDKQSIHGKCVMDGCHPYTHLSRLETTWHVFQVKFCDRVAW